MVQYSVTQALAELKLLDKRIRAYTSNSVQWVDVSLKTFPVDADRFAARVTAEYQSLSDLIKRRQQLKQAVILSNAQTRVKVGSWEGTIAEAIELKNSLSYKHDLLERMKANLLAARTRLQHEETNLQARLDRLLSSELGKDVKTNPETIQSITKSFHENNKVTFVDPLHLQDKIRELESEIESFETNVDWVLSEANGRTSVDV